MLNFLKKTIRIFNEKHCLQHASALAFDTALSLIPLLIIISWGAWHIKMLHPYIKEIQSFLINQIMNNPDTETTSTIGIFLNSADHLPVLEIVILSSVIWLLWRNIVFVFNHIFDVTESNTTWIKTIIMSIVALMTPLVIGVSLAVNAIISTHFNQSLHYSGTLASISAIICLLFLIFKYLPQKKISNFASITSSVITWFSLDLTKKAMTWYVSKNYIYHEIYKAFAAIPIFLLWLFAAWTIIILGAVVTRILNESK